MSVSSLGPAEPIPPDTGMAVRPESLTRGRTGSAGGLTEIAGRVILETGYGNPSLPTTVGICLLGPPLTS